MDRFELFNYFVNGYEFHFVKYGTNNFPIHLSGKIQSIQLEDGSGYKFNVTVQLPDRSVVTTFVRCK